MLGNLNIVVFKEEKHLRSDFYTKRNKGWPRMEKFKTGWKRPSLLVLS